MNQLLHLKLCQYKRCTDVRFDAFVDRMRGFVRENRALPTTPEQTVMVSTYQVRAHWRRNPHHMQQDLALRERVGEYLKSLGRKKQ